MDDMSPDYQRRVEQGYSNAVVLILTLFSLCETLVRPEHTVQQHHR